MSKEGKEDRRGKTTSAKSRGETARGRGEVMEDGAMEVYDEEKGMNKIEK